MVKIVHGKPLLTILRAVRRLPSWRDHIRGKLLQDAYTEIMSKRLKVSEMRQSSMFAAALFFAIALTASLSAAHAHATLLRSSPAAGETVDSVDAVELQFSGRVPTRFARISVTRGDGEVFDVNVSASESDDRLLIVRPEEPLGTGEYQLRWSVASEDGHRVSGEFAFAVR